MKRYDTNDVTGYTPSRPVIALKRYGKALGVKVHTQIVYDHMKVPIGHMFVMKNISGTLGGLYTLAERKGENYFNVIAKGGGDTIIARLNDLAKRQGKSIEDPRYVCDYEYYMLVAPDILVDEI